MATLLMLVLTSCVSCVVFVVLQFCAPAQVYCNEAIVAKYQPSGLNVYDIRIPCGSSPLCYDFSNVDKWLNTPEVMQVGGWDDKGTRRHIPAHHGTVDRTATQSTAPIPHYTLPEVWRLW
jgi:hypothetical protein